MIIFRTVLSLSLLMYSVASVSGTRQDVYRALNQINSNWPGSPMELLVNGRGSGATIVVGDDVRYSLQSEQPGYFLMAHVDSHGTMTVIRPDEGEIDEKRDALQLIYPHDGVLVAEPPLGKETLFVVRSEQLIEPEAIGLSSGQSVVQHKDSVQLAEQFAAAVSDLSRHSRVAVEKLEYYVEGAVGTTQYTTRGIVREFSDEEVAPSSGGSGSQPTQIALASTTPETRPISSTAGSPSSNAGNDTVGKSISLQMLQFEFNSATLLPDGMLNLDIFGEAFISGELRNQRYLLLGHTDDMGPESYNQGLSLQRAQSAQRYLIEKFGIPEDRLQVQGFGESRPMLPNVDAASRAKNRRVEFVRIP